MHYLSINSKELCAKFSLNQWDDPSVNLQFCDVQQWLHFHTEIKVVHIFIMYQEPRVKSMVKYMPKS